MYPPSLNGYNPLSQWKRRSRQVGAGAYADNGGGRPLALMFRAGAEVDTYDQRWLRAANVAAALVHTAQAAAATAVVVAHPTPAVAVTTTVLSGPPSSGALVVYVVGDARPDVLILCFFWLCAVAHWGIALPPLWDLYLKNVSEGRNSLRWLEYFFSSSFMVLNLCLLTGLREVSTLTLAFAANGSMILFGDAAERAAQFTRTRRMHNPKAIGGSHEDVAAPPWADWRFGEYSDSFRFYLYGFVGFLAVWVPLLWYFGKAAEAAGLPAWLYAAEIGEFLAFASFAVPMALQQSGVGLRCCRRRAERYGAATGEPDVYLEGEYAYIALSLLSKSYLGWLQLGAALAGG